MSVRCWLNDTDRETPQYCGRNLYQCHLVPHKPHTGCSGLKSLIRGERSATVSVNYDSCFYPLFPKTKFLKNTYSTILLLLKSQWSRGLRRGSAAARLQELWVRIPADAWVSVCCECCVLSGRGLCVELITHAEESY